MLDVGDGRLLVALLMGTGDGSGGRPYEERHWKAHPLDVLSESHGYPRGFPPNMEAFENITSKRGAKALSEHQFPDLATFGDSSDPNSVEFLQPAEISTWLGGSIGFEFAAIEFTSDEITHGIEGRLPWLREAGNYINERRPNSSMVQVERAQFISRP